MSSRLRKPSSKAVEIALNRDPSTSAEMATGSLVVKKAKASTVKARSVKKKSSAQKSGKAANLSNTAVEQGEDDAGPTQNSLYCVCLGSDDGTPMIQCEGCENWYA